MRNLIYILIFALSACGGDQYVFESEEEFDLYVTGKETPFIQKTETDKFVFESMMIPPIEGDTTEQRLFRLRIGLKDGKSVLEYNKGSDFATLEKEGYLSFDVIKDVFLESGDDEFTPVLHHYERNYGLKPTVDLVFHFNHVKPEKNVRFCYRDQLFGQGLIKMEFSKELFTNCYVKK